MITPNELRIGNWLLYEGKAIKVESIDPLREVKELGLSCSISVEKWIGGLVITYDGKWLNHFKPIALTAEWLTKFGFLDKGPNDSAKSNWEKQGIRCPSFDSFEGAFYCTNDWGAEHFAYCEHVHQFQNAYFALSGTELEIKLP